MKLKVISSMDIQAERTALIKRLEQINDKSLTLIRAIKHLVDFGLSKSEERIRIEQYNLEMDEADSEIDKGEFYILDEAEKMSKKMVEKDKPVIVWGKRAYISLQNAYKTIREDSLINAEKVRNDIFKMIRELAKHPINIHLTNSKRKIQETTVLLKSTLTD